MCLADSIPKPIHVWSGRHSEIDRTDFCSAEDHLRAELLRDPVKRQNLLRRRQFIRETIAPIFGLDSLKCSIHHLPNGQPTLIGNEEQTIHVSISAADDFFMIAASPQIPIGIDIEGLIPLDKALITRVLSQREIDELDSLSSANKILAFTAFWTQKEAYLKLLGMGLRVEPHEVETPLLTPDQLKRWRTLPCDSKYSVISWQRASHIVSLCAPNQQVPRVILHSETRVEDL